MPRRVPAVILSAALLGAALTGQAVITTAAHAAGAFAANDIVVYRVGTGSGTLASSGTAVFLDEYTPSGTLVQSVALPTATSGANKALVASGSASSEGELTLSADSRYLIATGYNAALGATGVGSSASSTVPRTIGRVDAGATINTATSLTDASTGNNVRSATSDDGSRFWVGGGAGGVRYATLGASTSTQVSGGSSVNFRQVLAASGQLYASSMSNGTTLANIGNGLPTTASQPVSNLNFSTAPTGPYGYSFLTLGTGSTPDTLYVADGSAAAVVKYVLQGSTWTARGSVAIATGLTGLTANDNNGTVTVFATTPSGIYKITDSSGLGGTLSGSASQISTAGTNTAFRGVAFAPGTVIGTGSGTPPPSPPTVAPAHTGLPAALGDPTNPTDALTVADDTYAASQVSVTAASSKQSVVRDADLTITGAGAQRTLGATPSGTGTATITLTASAPDGTSSTTTVNYAVSADLSGYGARYYSGAGNASAAIDVGGGYFVAADDETNALRLYQHGASGPPAASFDFSAQLGGSSEADLETAARSGDVIYWGGSLSNNSSGNAAPSRNVVFATRVSGTGAGTTLTYVGKYTSLKQDLVAWDQANGNPLGLADAAATGKDSHDPTGLNIEGMEFSPDGSAAYLGFRAPLEPPSNPQDALLVPVTNLPALTGVSGSATQATFGDAAQLDLGGLGVRDIRKNADGQYLIVGGTAGDANTDFELYQWDGDPAHDPRRTGTALPQLPTSSNHGSWETIVSVPDPLTAGAAIPLLADDGTVDWYGTGLTTKNGLATDLQKSVGVDLGYVAPAAQATTTTIAVAPATSTVGDQVTYTATVSAAASATGTPSGTVAFTDGAATISGCAAQPLSADGRATCSVTYPATGDHSVTATYSGDADFASSASSPVSQSTGAAASSITLSVPAGPYVAGDDLTITAEVTGANGIDPTGTVEFTDGGNDLVGCDNVGVSTAGTATCTVTGGLAAGRHRLGASYSGDAALSPATADPVVITVDPALMLDWAQPDDITYGTALSTEQLDATANVDGTFAYALADGTPVSAGSVLHAGSYRLVATFTPADADEYDSDTVRTTLTVDPAPLTISAHTQGASTYGQSGPAVTASYTGFVNGDTAADLITAPTCGTAVGPRTPAGSYQGAATCSGAAADDYTISYIDDAVTVNPAPLSVKANPGKSVYGAAATLTAAYSGFVNGDKPADLDGTLTFTSTPKGGGPTTTPDASTPVGKDALIPGGLTSTNYLITFLSGTLTVRKASLTVTVDDVSRPQGRANPPFTLSYQGFVNGEDESVLGGKPRFSTRANAKSDPGQYPVSVKGLTAANYMITYRPGTITVTAS